MKSFPHTHFVSFTCFCRKYEGVTRTSLTQLGPTGSKKLKPKLLIVASSVMISVFPQTLNCALKRHKCYRLAWSANKTKGKLLNVIECGHRLVMLHISSENISLNVCLFGFSQEESSFVQQCRGYCCCSPHALQSHGQIFWDDFAGKISLWI